MMKSGNGGGNGMKMRPKPRQAGGGFRVEPGGGFGTAPSGIAKDAGRKMQPLPRAGGNSYGGGSMGKPPAWAPALGFRSGGKPATMMPKPSMGRSAGPSNPRRAGGGGGMRVAAATAAPPPPAPAPKKAPVQVRITPEQRAAQDAAALAARKEYTNKLGRG